MVAAMTKASTAMIQAGRSAKKAATASSAEITRATTAVQGRRLPLRAGMRAISVMSPSAATRTLTASGGATVEPTTPSSAMSMSPRMAKMAAGAVGRAAVPVAVRGCGGHGVSPLSEGRKSRVRSGATRRARWLVSGQSGPGCPGREASGHQQDRHGQDPRPVEGERRVGEAVPEPGPGQHLARRRRPGPTTRPSAAVPARGASPARRRSPTAPVADQLLTNEMLPRS